MPRDLVATWKHLSRRAAKAGLRRRGYDVVARTHESPIPDTAAIPPETWGPSDLVGLDLRLDSAWAFLEEELAPFISQFPPDFQVQNGTYESVDAETLYAIVRWTRPRLVIELGSGASSHLVNAAGAREHRIFDPYPWAANRSVPSRASP